MPATFCALLAGVSCAVGGGVASMSPMFAAPESSGAVSYAYAPKPHSPGVSAGFVCRAGETCEEVLGDGARVYFDYARGSDNPYGALDGTLVVAPNGHVEARLSTRYRLDGRVTGETTFGADGTDRETTDHYDALGRLIARDATESGEREISERFAYDANDNALAERAAGTPEARYAYNGLDEQVRRDGKPLPRRYDARGSRLYDPDGTTYGYDDETDTIRSENARGHVYLLHNWPGGLRAVKAAAGSAGLSGEALDYYWTGDQLADAENAKTGRLSHYLLGGDRTWRAVTDAGGRLDRSRYAIGNYAGSVTAETGGGEPTRARTYSAYGRPPNGNRDEQADPLDLDENPFGFDGEYQDAETDEVYLRSREYDARGRFTTQDSLQTLNRYAAMDDDPGNESDPDGHLPHASIVRNWFANTVPSAGGFKYAGLLSAYSLIWQGGGMSEEALMLSLATSAASLIPFFGGAAADAIQQNFVEDGWDWGRFAGAAGGGVAADAGALAVWWRQMNALPTDDALLTPLAVRWHGTLLNPGPLSSAEASVYYLKRGKEAVVIKIFDHELHAGASLAEIQMVAEHHWETLDTINKNAPGFKTVIVGRDNNMIRQPFLGESKGTRLFRAQELKETALLQLSDRIRRDDKIQGYDIDYTNLGFWNKNTVVIDAGLFLPYVKNGHTITDPYSLYILKRYEEVYGQKWFNEKFGKYFIKQRDGSFKANSFIFEARDRLYQK